MDNILKYNVFESLDDEKEIILNSIIPFIIKKYDELSKWAKKKTYRTSVPIQKLIFKKKDDKWLLSIIASSWYDNDSNRLIQDLLCKTIQSECLKNNISMLVNIGYLGDNSNSDSTNKYIEYDVIKKEVVK